MKNRQRLNNIALIDLLDKINSQMPCFCVIQALSKKDKKPKCENLCYECIAEWLNKEESKND